MKKIKSFIVLAVIGATMAGCNDFLDDNRYPPTKILNTPEYWSNTSNCQLQVDRFSDELVNPYGTGGGSGTFYYSTLNDDQVGSSFADWAYTTVPGTNGNWTYTNVRGANYIISGIRNAEPALPEASLKNYEGIAKLIRAWSYFKLVRTFGDVVWESEVVDPSDDAILYGPRTSREIVMDSIMADLNYAIAAITQESSTTTWSKDLARCMKSEIGLFEGTFCKYRTLADNGLAPDDARSKKYLQYSAEASKQLLDNSAYGFTDDYNSIYNSVWGGMDSPVKPGEKITDFTKVPEIIFGRHYDSVNGRHSLISYTCSSTTTSGMSLSAFNSFLYLDGTPASAHTEAENVIGEPAEFGEDTDGNPMPAYYIGDRIALRDKRLGMITDPYVYYLGMNWSREGTSGMNASAGLGISKYDNVLLPVADRQNSANNYTSAPIYWLSYIALNYAEAMKELGQFTDAVFNMTLAPLYKRAGLDAVFTNAASLGNVNDTANNHGVDGTLWEIRRCRRCELMFDNNIRFYDLVRWHQLDKLDSNKYPEIMQGAYVANAPVKPSKMQGNYARAYDNNRTFNAKYYLQPIPSGQLDLNPALGQNPDW